MRFHVRPFTLSLLATSALALVQPAQAAVHRIHADHVLGTSLDVVVSGGDADKATRIAEVARGEIERLDLVLSGWRADSELARLNTSQGPFAASPDLFAVIARCEDWRERCDGAFSGRLGAVEALWREAETTGELPSQARLQAAAVDAERAQVKLDASRGIIDRDGVVFAVDALAKGYIIDAALRAAEAELASGQGVLIDLGGDMACAGAPPLQTGWRAGLARGTDADNLAPRDVIALSGGAVATSGGGARDRRIAGCEVLHVLQPNSGQPATDRTVSVVAADAAKADALATALGVMPVERGLAFAGESGAQARIIDASGAMHTTEGWARLLQPAAVTGEQVRPTPLKASDLVRVQNKAWPAGFGVEITYEIPRPTSGRAKPPFVVIWITDANGKLVRTLFHLGDHPSRYLDSNYVWFNALQAAGRANDLMSVTRPSRPPGRYTAAWDGKTDAGGVAPQGRYTINIEISREHGGHSLQSMPLTLGAAPVGAEAAGQGESGPAAVRYGPTSVQGRAS